MHRERHARVKALAQPTKQSRPVRAQSRDRRADLADRRAPGPAVRRSRARRPAPRSRFPRSPRHSIGRGSAIDDLIDFTPELRAEAVELIKRYGPVRCITPPVLSNFDGPLATLQVPADHGGANWPGGAMDPETNRLYIHSHTAVYVGRARRRPTLPSPISATWEDLRVRVRRRGGAAARGERRARRPRRGRGGCRSGSGPRPGHDQRARAAADQAALRSHHRVRHEHRQI